MTTSIQRMSNNFVTLIKMAGEETVKLTPVGHVNMSKWKDWTYLQNEPSPKINTSNLLRAVREARIDGKYMDKECSHEQSI
jgi:hypothetical protein